MMGMGRPMTRTPKMAQKQPRTFPKPVTGLTSPYPTCEEGENQHEAGRSQDEHQDRGVSDLFWHRMLHVSQIAVIPSMGKCAVGLPITGQVYLPLYWIRLKHIGISRKADLEKKKFSSAVPYLDLPTSVRIARGEFFLYLWQICLVFARQFVIWKFSTSSIHKVQMFGLHL